MNVGADFYLALRHLVPALPAPEQVRECHLHVTPDRVEGSFVLMLRGPEGRPLLNEEGTEILTRHETFTLAYDDEETTAPTPQLLIGPDVDPPPVVSA